MEIKTLVQIIMAILAIAQVILYARAESRLRKHILSEQNRHWQQEKEALESDVRECATCMLISLAIGIIATLI